MNIRETLENGPDLIAEKATIAIAKREALDQAKQDLNVAEAMATIRYQEEKNQSVIKAKVAIDQTVQLRAAELITRKADVEIAEIELERQNNKFIAARKLAEFELKEMQGYTAHAK